MAKDGPDPETIAVRVLERLAADPERIGRFLALTGLDPGSLRSAASRPDFLPAVLDHVVSDEALLVEVAAEAGLRPEAIAVAQQRLSPPRAWSA